MTQMQRARIVVDVINDSDVQPVVEDLSRALMKTGHGPRISIAVELPPLSTEEALAEIAKEVDPDKIEWDYNRITRIRNIIARTGQQPAQEREENEPDADELRRRPEGAVIRRENAALMAEVRRLQWQVGALEDALAPYDIATIHSIRESRKRS